jgi:hypothetical protein
MKIPADESGRNLLDDQKLQSRRVGTENGDALLRQHSPGHDCLADGQNVERARANKRSKMSQSYRSSRGSKNIGVLQQKNRPGMVTLPPERMAQLVHRESFDKYYVVEDEIGRLVHDHG